MRSAKRISFEIKYIFLTNESQRVGVKFPLLFPFVNLDLCRDLNLAKEERPIIDYEAKDIFIFRLLTTNILYDDYYSLFDRDFIPESYIENFNIVLYWHIMYISCLFRLIHKL